MSRQDRPGERHLRLVDTGEVAPQSPVQRASKQIHFLHRAFDRHVGPVSIGNMQLLAWLNVVGYGDDGQFLITRTQRLGLLVCTSAAANRFLNFETPQESLNLMRLRREFIARERGNSPIFIGVGREDLLHPYLWDDEPDVTYAEVAADPDGLIRVDTKHDGILVKQQDRDYPLTTSRLARPSLTLIPPPQSTS